MEGGAGPQWHVSVFLIFVLGLPRYLRISPPQWVLKLIFVVHHLIQNDWIVAHGAVMI